MSDNFNWYKKLKKAEKETSTDWGTIDVEMFAEKVLFIIGDYEKDSKKLNIKKHSAKKSK